MIVKIHESPNGKILVVSDKDIIGKIFEEGKLQLDLSKQFYRGEEKKEEKIKELIEEVYIAHVTGKKSIAFFKKLELVDEDKIVVVSGIPHAEVCFVRE